jgi:hypothetical protein
MKSPNCEKCGKVNPSPELREAAYEAEAAMDRYTGISHDVGEDWCDCCPNCGESERDYKCTCLCDHGKRLYDPCVGCMQDSVRSIE